MFFAQLLIGNSRIPRIILENLPPCKTEKAAAPRLGQPMPDCVPAARGGHARGERADGLARKAIASPKRLNDAQRDAVSDGSRTNTVSYSSKSAAAPAPAPLMKRSAGIFDGPFFRAAFEDGELHSMLLRISSPLFSQHLSRHVKCFSSLSAAKLHGSSSPAVLRLARKITKQAEAVTSACSRFEYSVYASFAALRDKNTNVSTHLV